MTSLQPKQNLPSLTERTMPQKKLNICGYWLFAKDWRAAQERSGRAFPEGFSQVCRECSAPWDDLSPDERRDYKVKAKILKKSPEGRKMREDYANLHRSTPFRPPPRDRRRSDSDVDSDGWVEVFDRVD